MVFSQVHEYNTFKLLHILQRAAFARRASAGAMKRRVMHLSIYKDHFISKAKNSFAKFVVKIRKLVFFLYFVRGYFCPFVLL